MRSLSESVASKCNVALHDYSVCCGVALYIVLHAKCNIACCRIFNP